MGEEVEILEDHPHLGPDLVDVRLRIGDLHAIHPDPARIRQREVIDAPEEGALSRAAGSDDDEHLSLLDLQIDTREDFEGAVGLVQIFDTHDWMGHDIKVSSL